MPDDIQPEQGQGSGGEGIFDSYLATVPEDGREAVAAYLKNAEKEVNSRFQNASELQKQYEPFSQVQGIGEYDANSLSQLIAWHREVQDPEKLKNWVKEAATELGLTPAEAAQVQQAEESGQITKDDIQKLVDAQVAEKLGPLQAQFEEKTQAEQTQAIEGEIQDAFGKFEAADNRQFSEDEKSLILELASTDAFVKAPDWLDKGFDRFKSIVALGQHQLVDGAAQQPAPSLTTGGTATVEQPLDFKVAAEQAKERLRQARQ
jgi:hypothetical protein